MKKESVTESKETPEDEAAETPETQKQEAETGTEEHGEVKIPETFQRQVTALVYACTSREECDFIRTCISNKEDELREAKMKKGNKNKNPVIQEFAGEMPA